jgi:multiple sugar transport system substrate-binding protein
MASGGPAASLPRGQTLNVVVGSFMAPGVTMFSKAWEDMTGNKANVVQIPYGDMYQRVSQAYANKTGEFDIAIYAATLVPEFAESGGLLNLEPYYPAKTNWGTVIPKIAKGCYVNLKSGNARYAVPLDGDIIFGYYRTDAFRKADNQQKFKAQFGYDLNPPETWQQYKDMAKFFTGWNWGITGKPGWGNLAARKANDVSLYLLSAQASAYGAHPDNPGQLFFDPDTLEPQINNPAWVQAVQDWIDLAAYAPDQENNYAHGDMMGNWVGGDYALAVNWADLGMIAQDITTSIVQGKIGYFILPGSTKVWNIKTKAWDELSQPNHAPYMSFGGWKATIASTCKDPTLAFNFLDWIDSDDNSFTAVMTPGTARNPYRQEHFADVKRWETFSTPYVDAGPFLEAQSESLNHPNCQSELFILKAGAYLQSLDNWSQQAFHKAVPIQQALDSAAAEWKTITASVDFATQKSLYRGLYGLS